MNHCVPDFEMDEDYAISNSSGLSRPKKSPMAEEEIMELLWQNGQVVMQSQNQRSLRPKEESATQLFIQEDEMASWLHYPIDDSFYSDLIYPAPTAPVAPIPDDVRIPSPSAAVTAAALRPPIPPPRRADVESPGRIQNFLHFSRPKKGRTEAGPLNCNKVVRETTPESRVSHDAVQVSGRNIDSGVAETSLAVGGDREAGQFELTMTSSPGGSGASVSGRSAEPVHKLAAAAVTEDRKRKGIEVDDVECQSEERTRSAAKLNLRALRPK